MRFATNTLGTKIAANAVSATLTSFIAVPLVLLSSPAYAYPVPNSQAEYEQYVYEATTLVNQARDALNSAEQRYLNNVIRVQNATSAVNDATTQRDTALAEQATAQANYTLAQSDLTSAQYNYDNLLIPDPQQPVIERVPGLRVDIYNQINSAGTAIPPRTTNYNLCKTVTFTHINHNWGGGNIEGCGNDYVMLHYTGYLTIPEETPYGYDFLNIADDGWYMTLDGVTVNDNWTLKGCSGWWSEKQHLQSGHSYAIDAWYYEWGGGACSTLYYDNGYNWGVIPAAWYSQNALTQTVYINDPALLVILQEKQNAFNLAATTLSDADIVLASSETTLTQAQDECNLALEEQAAINAEIPVLEQNLANAITNLESIPRYVPPVTPEPTQAPQPEPTMEPQPVPEPTPEPEQAPVTPPTNEEIVTELWAAAQEDDIQVPEELAAVPVLGDAIVAIADAINYLGNVGADMTPEVREKSKKVVVSAIIVTQVATQAVATATMAASSATATASPGRRK